jgi:ligand-binding sensor domain-containing protein
MSIKRYLYAIVFGLMPALLLAQWNSIENPYQKFDLLSTQTGLSNNRILDILQDSFGYIWIATYHGLNRYNGLEVQNYFHDPDDSTSIPGNIITDLEIDDNGQVWIGTTEGLCVFSGPSSGFKRILLSEITGSEGRNHIRKLLSVSAEQLLIETVNGELISFNPITYKSEVFQHKAPSQTDTYYYHDLLKIDDQIWIAGRALGPLVFDISAKEFHTFIIGKTAGREATFEDASFLFKDSRNILWVGGSEGLFQFDRNTQKFKMILRTSSFDMLEDNSNRLWLATGSGLQVVDLSTESSSNFSYDPHNHNTLPDNHITCLFEDRTGVKWIGTREGIAIHSPYKNRFSHIYSIPGNEKTISSNHISCITELKNGNIWVGTKHDGVDILNCIFEKIDNLNTETSPALLADHVSVILEDSKGYVWLGMWSGKGFHRFDPRNRKLKTFILYPHNNNYGWIKDIIEDTQGDVWISSWSSFGVFRFDGDNGVNMDWSGPPDCRFKDLSSRFTSKIVEDEKQRIWVGTTYEGLNCLDPETENVFQFPDTPDDSTAFWGDEVTAIHRDEKGNIWVGGKGLNLIKHDNFHLTHFTTDNGLPDNKILAIKEDQEGQIWVSTEKGLTNLDPESKKVVSYTKNHGLLDAEFTSASVKFNNGRLGFGTKNGLIMFDPMKMPKNTLPPKLCIERVKVFEEEMSFNWPQPGSISLPYHENYLNIDLNALDYNNPKGNIYGYRLVGLNDEWTIGDHLTNKVKYHDLNPGSYTFEFKAANSDGGWTNDMISIPVRIKPPFWKTWWFISLEVLALGLLIWLFIKWRESRINEQHQTELLEQRLLRSQMNPHFIFNALGAIQSFIMDREPLEASSYLSRFAELVRSILYSSRGEMISVEKELKILENYCSLQQLRYDHTFDYEIIIDENIDQESTLIPSMIAQPFIENAIEHGVRNISEKGQIFIRILKERENDYLTIEIEDNGAGINRHQDSKKETNHISMATKITAERLKGLNHSQRELEIIDLSSRNKRGTLIRFSVPFRIWEDL